jgi:uncharacterized membrane protein
MVIAFHDEGKADAVLEVLRQLDGEHVVALRDAAVVVRQANGQIAIHETRDFTTRQGVLAGALAGGLIGLLRGNALAGGAVGAAGGLVAARVLDLGFPDQYLSAIAAQLAPGSSAIVAVVDFAHVNPAMTVLDQFDGGTILRHTLPADVAQRLAAAVED